MASLTDRMVRAAKLDSGLYEEVENDPAAMGQALTVVLISSLAAGIGSLVSGVQGLVMITIATLISWIVWAFLTYFIGTRLLPEPQTKADMGQLLRTVGFSSSPGVVRVLGIIPGLGSLSALVASLWMLVAMVVAVRQALDYSSTGRAVGVCGIGWLANLVAFMILSGFTPGLGINR
jgi:hypothetical protein